MRIEPEISGVDIVLVGNFNPAIFTPAWFALHELLPRRVAEGAELEVAHRELTVFKIEWCQLHVTLERFQLQTTSAPYIRLCDLALRVFREHLHHTPIRALGINRSVHFRVGDLGERDRIGRRLAPVKPWGQWCETLGLGEEQGGMTSLKMSALNREATPLGGEVNVTVEPSKRIDDIRVGVYVGVNDHYSMEPAGAETNEALLALLERNFEASLEQSEGIIDQVMSLSEEREI